MSISPATKSARPRGRDTVRTTVSLPAELLSAADSEVEAGRPATRSDFIAEAIVEELRRRERARVDAEWAAVLPDADYQAEHAQIMAEFEAAHGRH